MTLRPLPQGWAPPERLQVGTSNLWHYAGYFRVLRGTKGAKGTKGTMGTTGYCGLRQSDCRHEHPVALRRAELSHAYLHYTSTPEYPVGVGAVQLSWSAAPARALRRPPFRLKAHTPTPTRLHAGSYTAVVG